MAKISSVVTDMESERNQPNVEDIIDLDEDDNKRNSSHTDVDEDEDKTRSLNTVLVSLCFTMSLFGMFHYRSERVTVKDNDSRQMARSREGCGRRLSILSQIYSTIVLLILWLNG